MRENLITRGDSRLILFLMGKIRIIAMPCRQDSCARRGDLTRSYRFRRNGATPVTRRISIAPRYSARTESLLELTGRVTNPWQCRGSSKFPENSGRAFGLTPASTMAYHYFYFELRTVLRFRTGSPGRYLLCKSTQSKGPYICALCVLR